LEMTRPVPRQAEQGTSAGGSVSSEAIAGGEGTPPRRSGVAWAS
jgi:hypothetical protein